MCISASFQGELVVRGPPHVTYQCTAVACPNPDEPCNNCVFLFTYGELGDPIIARPAEDWDPVAPARGETPLACFDRSCEEGLQLACHGNDVEAHCSPGVPARITAMHGVLEGRTLHVSSVELADGPREQRADSIRPGGRGARPFACGPPLIRI